MDDNERPNMNINEDEIGGAAFLPHKGHTAGDDVRQECRTSYMEKDQYISISGTKLPHWHQDLKMQFVTFRLADSLPQSKLVELAAYKKEWEKQHPLPWSQETQEEYDHRIRVMCDKWIDQGYGSCILRNPDVRMLVEDALYYYDGKEYIVHYFVIMPNHVHALLSPICGFKVIDSIGKVKGYTSHSINKKMGTNGKIWQKSIFDRMVRDQENYEQYKAYIQNNPKFLSPNEFTLGGAAFLPHKDGTTI